MLSKHGVGIRNSSGITQPQSSKRAEPLWADPGLKSEIGVREKRRQGLNRRNFPEKSVQARNKKKAAAS